MALTLDQALGQLDISAVAIGRVDHPGTGMPAPAAGQVHFIAVLHGAGMLACAGGPRAVRAGQLLLLPRDAAPQAGAGLELAHCLLGARLLDGRSLFDFLPLPHTLDAGGSELFTGAIPEMLREAAHGGPGSSAIVTCLARRLVTTLVRDAWPDATAIQPAGVDSKREQLRRIIELMRKDPARDYTLDGLADAAGMSRTVFHREFKQAYGGSPLSVLREIRLKRAEELLAHTDMPIKTITGRLGYRSRSHFWKLFKDTHGIDPEQFRQQGAARLPS
ncbi:helix-turn-helix domain-containing protein [Massilia niastensis]|uniref:helix-turn-helix domain-containing protein n=1 Tax=Massilia niastensis TaxID=544911 RepID=UPI00037BCE4D|nr:AraC family transcriptional regulator [Massilia niastensis]